MDRGTAPIPRLDVVRQTVAVLREHGIVAALGGSGLLAALGLTDRVRDWDLTTDAHPDAVAAALSSAQLDPLPVTAGDGRFATRARFRIEAADHEVDLLVGFALHAGGSTVRIPTQVTGEWHGLPLGDPAGWALAYRLMGRDESAVALQGWLDAHPARHHDDRADD